MSTSPDSRSPWAATSAQRKRIVADSQTVIGRSLERVAYHVPATSDFDAPRQFEGFDEVDMAVELRVSDGERFYAIWRTEGYNEGLSFGKSA